MKLAFTAAALLALGGLLLGCGQRRSGGELRLKHEVTVATPQGERSFSSVVSMDAYQTYNYGAGTSGWGGIAATLTGSAVRVPLGGHDFFFLLANRGITTAWSQIGLIKDHFGLPNSTTDNGWVRQWKKLASSDKAVDLTEAQYPPIAVMPSGGWIDDARVVDVAEARDLGLRILRYRLQITSDPVTEAGFAVRYRPTDKRFRRTEVAGDSLTVVNGRS